MEDKLQKLIVDPVQFKQIAEWSNVVSLHLLDEKKTLEPRKMEPKVSW